MKTRKIASSLPLLAGIALGIVSLTVPFLLAKHSIFTGENKYTVDNYLFFLWGKYYTVVGTKQIISQWVMYDFGDFPMYAMVSIIIGIIVGAMSLIVGRGVILNVKGRALKLKLDVNPLWFQMASIALLLFSFLYMNEAKNSLYYSLTSANYEIENGPYFEFLAGSIAAFVISAAMTGIRFVKEEIKEKNKQSLQTA